jgi:phasin protein
MDEVTTSPLAAAIPQLGTSFVQASSDATRRLCEQGESLAKTVGKWSTEVSHFVTRRATRNAEAMTRIAKCQNFPDMLAVQAQWVQDATDDYLKEMGKLMDVNSRIMGDLLASNRSIESIQPQERARL